jgi:hypothetical protein
MGHVPDPPARMIPFIVQPLYNWCDDIARLRGKLQPVFVLLQIFAARCLGKKVVLGRLPLLNHRSEASVRILNDPTQFTSSAYSNYQAALNISSLLR